MGRKCPKKEKKKGLFKNKRDGKMYLKMEDFPFSSLCLVRERVFLVI